MIKIGFDFCFKINENLIKINQKIASNSKLVLESIFFRFLIDFWPILDQFWLQNCRRSAVGTGLETSSIPNSTSNRFLIDLLTSETASGPISKRFWLKKWSKNRPKIYQKSMSVFDFVSSSIFYSKIHVTSKPRTSKINKNLLVF